MKVYCNDCKWRRGHLYKYITCNYIIRSYLTTKDCPEERVTCDIRTFAEPKKDNKNNNCKYYKRKWWKVWIKL